MSEKKEQEQQKRVKYVPSRYKQAMENVSIESNRSKERSCLQRSSKDSTRVHLSGSCSEDSSNNSKTSSFSGSTHGKSTKTSTPSSKGQACLPLLDASAVTSVDGNLTIPHLKERIVPTPADCVKRKITKNNVPSQHPVITTYEDKRENNYDEKLADMELEVLHASYLQAAFLESEAKRALEARSSNALETLHKLFALVLQYIEMNRTKHYAVKIMSSLLRIHEHCENQKAILKPVFEILPTLEVNYKNLAEAINSTKHKLQVKNVILPESDCEGDVIEAVEKMKQFIQGFFESVSNHEKIVSCCESMKSFENASEILIEALERGFSLLTKSIELSTSEALFQLSCECL